VAARLSLRSASLSGARCPGPGTTRAVLRLHLGGDPRPAAIAGRPPIRRAASRAPYLGSRTRSATLALPVPGDVARAMPVGRLEGRQRDPRLVGAGRRLDAPIRDVVRQPLAWR
jgi:hypothetical protein